MALHNPVEAELRVRFAETDAQRIAYHANYIVWFEVGRTAFLEATGLSRDRMRALRFRFVMAEVQCRYLSPAYFDDRLIVRTALQTLSRRSFTLRYEIVRAETGELLAEGGSAQVAVNKAGKAVEIMPAVRAALEQEA
ncbi:MAG: acyl-CoA thioesterase [Chloroflexi bacterium]|nr:acyl-CoA thioesterase [Chloroflexota bacterium]